MDTRKVLSPHKEWPCTNFDGKLDYDHPCRTNLGTVVNGELAIDLESVSTITTNGVNTTLTCKYCGRPKTWYAKKMAVLEAMNNYQVRDMVEKVREAQARTRADQEWNSSTN